MIHQINLTCLFISLLFIQDQMTEEEEDDIGRNLTRREFSFVNQTVVTVCSNILIPVES